MSTTSQSLLGLSSLGLLILLTLSLPDDLSAESRLGRGTAPPLGAISQTPASTPTPAPETATWTSYTNARFGTVIDYPAALFTALPPPANNDGRRFETVDGSARFSVWAGYNALNETPADCLHQSRNDTGLSTVLSTQPLADAGFRLTGLRDGALVLHAELFGTDDIIHGFEAVITNPDDHELLAQLTRTMRSLRVVPAGDTSATPVPAVRGLGDTSTSPQSTADIDPAPLTDQPTEQPGAIHIPAPGSPERAALVKAARATIGPALGQPAILRVDTLYSQGSWAYLAADPLAADGTPFNWLETPFAEAWRNDAMSSVIMVLLQADQGGWRVIDHVIGPTDVYWLNWAETYDLPYDLFFQENAARDATRPE